MSAAMELFSLVCLFVVAWSGITAAVGPTIVPLVVKENEEVVLECSLGKNAQGKIFSWTKDGDEVMTLTPPTRRDIGQDFQGRVSHFPEALQSGNASIVIRGAKVSDSGVYVCEFPNDPPGTRATISLTVEPPVVQKTVEEGGEAILECSLGKNAQGNVFYWWKDGSEKEEVFMFHPPAQIDEGRLFQGRVFHFPEALQSGNATIVIRPAKVSDSGRYICEIVGQPPKTQAIISLTVEKLLKDRSAEKIPGAAPMPVIAILKLTEGSLLLQCLVLGAFPKPHVEWQNSAGTVLQAEQPQVTSRDDGKYDTVLNVTVTKSGKFKCIATQKDIHHQIHAPIFVSLHGPLKPLLTLRPLTDDGVPLDCKVHGVSPKTTLRLKDGSGKVILTKKPDGGENGRSYDIILQTTVTESGDYYCVATQEETGLETEMKQYVNVNPPPPEPTGLSSVAVAFLSIFVTLIVVGVLYALKKHCKKSKSKKEGSDKQQESVALQGSVPRDVTSSDATAGPLPPSSAPV